MDIFSQTKKYLQDYRAQKEYISSLKEEIKDIYETATNMVFLYEERIGYSTEEKLHPGARLAEDEKLQAKQYEIKQAQKIIDGIDRGVNRLPDIERKIIEMRYFKPKPTPWIVIGREVQYSERNCRKLHAKAVRFISISIFGLAEVLKTERQLIG